MTLKTLEPFQRFLYGMDHEKPLETVQDFSVDLDPRAEAAVLMKSLRVLCRGTERFNREARSLQELTLRFRRHGVRCDRNRTLNTPQILR